MKNGKQFTGFAWGGDWKGFCYPPHFEMTGGLTVKDLLTVSTVKRRRQRSKCIRNVRSFRLTE